MPEYYDTIIIGGGPGGYTAALYCARAGLKTLLIEKLSAGGQMATSSWVENYPGFENGVDGFELGEKMRLGAEKFGAQSVFSEVLSVELQSDPKTIRTDGGDYEAGTVILATGASAKHLGLPEEEQLINRGVAYCATCDGMRFKGKTVIVNGGGDTAVTDALFLSRICAQVYLVHRRDTLRASKSYLEAVRQADNLTFLPDSRIRAFLHEKRVTAQRSKTLRPVTSRRLPATEFLSLSVARPTRQSSAASSTRIPTGISSPTRRRARACRACMPSAICAQSRSARSSRPQPTAPWHPNTPRNI
jgi:thioredoxin reductase (NADPH)